MIDLSSTLKVSLHALRVNKMRSILTMLGIIIGVSAVIIMLAVGTGASEKISQQIASAGTNLLIIFPGSATAGGLRMGTGSESTLNSDDAEAIKKECPAVEEAVPILNGAAQVVYGNQNWSTGVYGVTPAVLYVRDWPLANGRMFTDQEVTSAAKVCVIGRTVADNLFGNTDPINKIIRIKKLPFTVLGVLTEKGQSLVGQDQDDIIYIPITTAQRKLFGRDIPKRVRSIMVKTRTMEDLTPAMEQITALLRQRHRLGANQESDFTVRNLTQMLSVAEQSSQVMTLLLGAIASVSLLVGGIGIMNIMLVSVTERTKEIGIRMAVGARIWDIRFQFIIEALTLSIIGGLIGIILGIAGAKIITLLADWPTIISPFSLLFAVSFSAFIGIFFGFYPAYKASLLNPIEALRYE